ncbi:MAG: M48 family metalloprotease [Pirellulales bacterium]|nr:M48 family metalloprotease [Pirellulales bacterium]
MGVEGAVEPLSSGRSSNSSSATPLDPSDVEHSQAICNAGERCDLNAIQRDVLGAFEGKIEPVKVPLGYRLGILLVAVVMVILPLIYLAIIAAVAYGVYYHTVNHTGMLAAGSGRWKLMVFVAYLAPMIVGGILVVFMFKPLFSRPPKRGKPFSLTRREEPLVFAFVERICQAVRAPIPKRVDVDCQVNASASFRHGFWSMIQNDLVLTIGMPLVVGLNLRQFAGVLAHEFGHFSQGAGMRLTYIIRSISHWFTRVVYERDQWDEQLTQWSERTDLRIGWVLYLARVFVWVTRRILWVLMMIGHIVSSLMLRQMEFDADRHEARLAGSDVFEETAHQLMVLNVASQGAQSDLGSFYREGRLADDLPQLIMANVQQLPAEVLERINTSIDQSTTGLLDTHPCDKDRIASARRENTAGIFHLDDPASILFRDFSGQSKAVTWEYYQDCLGRNLNRTELHPIDDLLQRQELEQKSYKAIDRVFQGNFNVTRPLRFTSWSVAPPQDVQQAEKELKNVREQMLVAAPKYREMCERFAEAPRENQKILSKKMELFEQAVGRRISLALELLHTPEVASKIDHADKLSVECKELLPTLQQLETQVEQAAKAGAARNQLVHLLNQLSERGQDEGLIQSIRQAMQMSGGLLVRTREALKGVQYPFDHAKGKISIAEYVLPKLPDSEDFAAICHALDTLIDNVFQLKAHMVGQLCVIAESVESAIELNPLPSPQPETDVNNEA